MKRENMHALVSPMVATNQTETAAEAAVAPEPARPVTMVLQWEQDPKFLDPDVVAKLRGCAEEITRATLRARERLAPLLPDAHLALVR